MYPPKGVARKTPLPCVRSPVHNSLRSEIRIDVIPIATEIGLGEAVQEGLSAAPCAPLYSLYFAAADKRWR